MDMRALQLFCHLADTLHFGKTSEAMHVSPSTLSRTIQRLEQAVGQPLLERDNRSVTLTEAGRRFRDFADQQLHSWQQFRSKLHTAPVDINGTLRVFCSVTASYSHLPAIIDRLRPAHPRLDIALATGDPALAFDKLLADEADIAIAARSEQLPQRIFFTSIGLIPLSLIAPTFRCPLQQQLGLSPVPWNAIPFILPEHGPARRRIDQWFRRMKIRPQVYATVEGHEAIVSMVAVGCGVGIAPDVVLENSPMRDRVSRLNTGWAIEPFDVGVCCLRSNRRQPAIQAFIRAAIR
jgi:LysR family positive regulator for ilvC